MKHFSQYLDITESCVSPCPSFWICTCLDFAFALVRHSVFALFLIRCSSCVARNKKLVKAFWFYSSNVFSFFWVSSFSFLFLIVSLSLFILYFFYFLLFYFFYPVIRWFAIPKWAIHLCLWWGAKYKCFSTSLWRPFTSSRSISWRNEIQLLLQGLQTATTCWKLSKSHVCLYI